MPPALGHIVTQGTVRENAAALVTGASGLLGSAVALGLSQDYSVTATFRNFRLALPGCDVIAQDLLRPEEIDSVVAAVRPAVIVHCAAETRVDWCEDHPDEAFAVNAQATRHLATAARDVGATFGAVVTDAARDAARGGYSEDDPPGPVNVYARSKLAGEVAVRETLDAHLVVRTTMFGWNAQPKPSLAEWVLDRGRRGLDVPGFEDVRFS